MKFFSDTVFVSNSVLLVTLIDKLNAGVMGDCEQIKPPSVNDYRNQNPSTRNGANGNWYDNVGFGGGSYWSKKNRNNPYRWGVGGNPGSGFAILDHLRDVLSDATYTGDQAEFPDGYNGASGANMYTGSGANMYTASGANMYTASGANMYSASSANFMGSNQPASAFPGGSIDNYLPGGMGTRGQMIAGSGSNPFAASSGTTVGATVTCAKQQLTAKAQAARTHAQNKAYQLRYYGGAVMTDVRVFPIYWGSNYAMNGAYNLDSYYRSLLASPWFNLLKQFSIANSDAGRIKSGAMMGSYHQTLNRTSVVNGKHIIDDQAIQDRIEELFVANAIPFPDHQTYYPVHLAPGINLTINAVNATSCASICAYHARFFSDYWNENAYYGVIVDPSTCYKAYQCGNTAYTNIQNFQMTASHELMESITDPFIGYGWFDYSTKQEVGDMCNQAPYTFNGNDGLALVATKVFNNNNPRQGCSENCPYYSLPNTSLNENIELCDPPFNPSFEMDGGCTFTPCEGTPSGWTFGGTSSSYHGISKNLATTGTYSAYITGDCGTISAPKTSTAKTLTSESFKLTPGLNYNVTFHAQSRCMDTSTPAPVPLSVIIIHNATWYKEATGQMGYDPIQQKLGETILSAVNLISETTVRSFIFTAYDYTAQIQFNSATGRGFYIDTIQVSAITPPKCDDGKTPIISINQMPNIHYHFCEHPSNPEDPSFEEWAAGDSTIPFWPTQWDVSFGGVVSGFRRNTNWYQSGKYSLELGPVNCERGSAWTKTFSDWKPVTPGMIYEISFFAYRLCSTSSSTSLTTTINLSAIKPTSGQGATGEQGNWETVIYEDIEIGIDSSAAKKKAYYRSFIAPPEGYIGISFETKNQQRFAIDTVQMIKLTKDPVFYAGGSLAIPVNDLTYGGGGSNMYCGC